MNWSELLVALVPDAVVTVTSTVPIGPVGTVAEIEVGPFTTCDAVVPPKRTWVTPRKLVPMMVTVVPAFAVAGEIDVTVGGGAVTLKVTVPFGLHERALLDVKNVAESVPMKFVAGEYLKAYWNEPSEWMSL